MRDCNLRRLFIEDVKLREAIGVMNVRRERAMAERRINMTLGFVKTQILAKVQSTNGTLSRCEAQDSVQNGNK